jgi:transcriptional regulator with XRE-family HTH domain
MTQLQVAQSVEFSPQTGLKRDTAKRLSRNTYAMYESGKSKPSFDILEKIAGALQVPAGWIAFGEGATPDGARPVEPNITTTRQKIVLRISVERPDQIDQRFGALAVSETPPSSNPHFLTTVRLPRTIRPHPKI